MEKIIPLFRVSSSAVQQLGHDGVDTLRVQFHSGHIYAYHGVSPAAFGKLIHAKSIGQHFLSQIKGRYPERKVTQ